MKRSLLALAFVASAAAVPAQAQSVVAETLGAITGAVVCNQFCGGIGRVIATAGCAVIGAQIGRRLSTPDNPPPVYPGAHGGPVYQQGGPVYAPQPMYPDSCMTDGYFKGEYNPAAARAYCRGAMEAQRRSQAMAERDAYYEGLRRVQSSERDAERWGASGRGY